MRGIKIRPKNLEEIIKETLKVEIADVKRHKGEVTVYFNEEYKDNITGAVTELRTKLKDHIIVEVEEEIVGREKRKGEGDSK